MYSCETLFHSNPATFRKGSGSQDKNSSNLEDFGHVMLLLISCLLMFVHADISIVCVSAKPLKYALETLKQVR